MKYFSQDTSDFWIAPRPTCLNDIEHLLPNQKLPMDHVDLFPVGDFHYKYNRWYFRDENNRLHRHDDFSDCYKIALYGCSFTVGDQIPYNQTLDYHLESNINNCVCYNFADAGSSNDEIVRKLYMFNEIVKPDLTLILWSQPRRGIHSVSNKDNVGIVTRDPGKLTTLEALEMYDDELLHKYNYQKNITLAKLLVGNRKTISSTWTDHVHELKSRDFYHFEYPTPLLHQRRKDKTMTSVDKRHPDGTVNAEVVQRILKCIK